MKKPLRISPKTDLMDVLNLIDAFRARTSEGTKAWRSSQGFVTLHTTLEDDHGRPKTLAVQFTVKDIFDLVTITGSPILLKGRTGCGKTEFTKAHMNAAHGSDGFALVQVAGDLEMSDLLDLDEKEEREEDALLSDRLRVPLFDDRSAICIDEVGRSHPRVSGALLRLASETVFSPRPGKVFPVGIPYSVNGQTSRYLLSAATANPPTSEYAGCFELDKALVDRFAIHFDMDDTPPTLDDDSKRVAEGKRKRNLPRFHSCIDTILTILESLPVIPMSSLAGLFMKYLMLGTGVCVRTRNGKKRLSLMPTVCQKCHLEKSMCSKITPPEGRSIEMVTDVARGIAAIRLSKVFEGLNKGHALVEDGDFRKLLSARRFPRRIRREIAKRFVLAAAVTGEDVAAAFALIAPEHCHIDEAFVSSKPEYEQSKHLALKDFAWKRWEDFRALLTRNEHLLSAYVAAENLSQQQHADIARIVMNEDPALLAVLTALKNGDVPEDLFDTLKGTIAA